MDRQVDQGTGSQPGERAAAGIKLSAEDAEALTARLSRLSAAARLFGSALSGVDVQVGASLQPGSGRVRWTEGPDGRRSVTIQLDLTSLLQLLKRDGAEEEGGFVDVFKAGFLHELGHILYSSTARSFPTETREDRLLEAIWHTLEDARVERKIMLAFRGARRYLEGHAAVMSKVAGDRSGESVLAQVVAALFLQIWGAEAMLEAVHLAPDTTRLAGKLRDSLRKAVDQESSAALADWVRDHLLPLLSEYLASEREEPEGFMAQVEQEPDPDSELPPSEPKDEDQAGRVESERGVGPSMEIPFEPSDELLQLAEEIEDKMTAPSLLFCKGETMKADGGDPRSPSCVRSQVILYPHIDGSIILDEVPVARAWELQQTEKIRAVVRVFSEFYGPRVVEAFGSEASALRRAFQVNFESRFGGRHTSGKHIGVSHLRRFAVNQDLRLFQRIEKPDKLSYYFHLLLDVSPSMLLNRNLQKALAVGYAFASSLESLHVPVDVTLYSSALTELHVHGQKPLDRFFGGNFGYLSAGTHEIEAIAYAKQQADGVSEERKIIIVTTDGRPNSSALARTGARDLKSYYYQTLTPWLTNSGIDLLGIGIGSPPSYHPHAVTISSGWEAVAVFMRLLDDIIARARTSHAALWR
jgi:hypothetical protein